MVLAFLVLAGCTSDQIDRQNPTRSDDQLALRTGAEVLAGRQFDLLQGKRVGLITNHTAKIDSVHLIDALFRDPQVELVALFGPEHGLRGLSEGGDKVTDGVDAATGVPVFSLYGANRQPPDSVLATLDILVFDIQDVGARFYTYISTMGLAMQAAARAGVPFLVLDRPNPLGRRVEGPVREPEFKSFVGLYPIPITHGLTVGELAVQIKSNGWLEDLEELQLEVVETEGWDHTRLWPETGRPWVPTSPNIPDFETALVYPGTCLFEGTSWSEGRGTPTPFRLVGYPGIDGASVADTLNALNLPGVRFEAATFTPVSIPGKSSNPKHEGIELGGVRLIVTDYRSYEPVRTGIEVVKAAFRATPESEQAGFFRKRGFDRLAGTSTLRESITGGR
ncbi:MAG: exo-beta-N-acetylmuramidase NamZ domain-containing protein [Rhodothermia bacterium]